MRLFFLFLPLLLFSQVNYLVKIDNLQRNKVVDNSLIQLGRSPFYLSKDSISVNNVDLISRNSTYRLAYWYHEKVLSEQALNISIGSKTAPIAVIDSGTDLELEALQTHYWINSAEDINSNNKLDSLDINGIDDDGNGYVDDVIGYDFVDTQINDSRFDFNQIDPFPDDEFPSSGHGTPINSLLAEFAPSAPIMVLRAADANGLLEEDDIAKALIYATENGAKIINLSFANNNYSPFMEALLNYVTEQGVILVAASGNDGNNFLSYPAAYKSVIAVGSSNQFDERVNSSNYGDGLTLLAPGVNIILRGRLGLTYDLSGTSFAAPFVSATAALILVNNSELSFEDIKNRLILSANDILQNGLDNESGAGRLNMLKALENPVHTSLEILLNDKIFTQNKIIPIKINAFGTDIGEIKFSVLKNDDIINSQQFNNRFFYSDSLYSFNSQFLAEGTYSVTLNSKLWDKKELKSIKKIIIDRTKPVIKVEQILEIDKNYKLINFVISCNESSQIDLKLNKSGNSFNSSKTDFKHFFTLNATDIIGNDSIIVQAVDLAENRSVLKIKVDLKLLEATRELIPNRAQEFTEIHSYPAILAEFTTDINTNDKQEIWVFQFTKNQLIDSLFIYEENGLSFNLLKKIKTDLLARDFINYSDQNLMLLSYNGRSELWKIDTNFNIIINWSNRNKGLATRFIQESNLEPQILMRNINDYTLFNLDATSISFEFKSLFTGKGLLGIPKVAYSINKSKLAFADHLGQISTYTFSALTWSPYKKFTNNLGNSVHSILIMGDTLIHLGDNLDKSNNNDDAYNNTRRSLKRFNWLTGLTLDSLYFKDYQLEANNSFLMANKDTLLVNSGSDLFRFNRHLSSLDKDENTQFYNSILLNGKVVTSWKNKIVITNNSSANKQKKLSKLSWQQLSLDSLKLLISSSFSADSLDIYSLKGKSRNYLKREKYKSELHFLFSDSSVVFINFLKNSSILDSASSPLLLKNPSFNSVLTLINNSTLEIELNRAMNAEALRQSTIKLKNSNRQSIWLKDSLHILVFFNTEEKTDSIFLSLFSQEGLILEQKSKIIFFENNLSMFNILEYKLINEKNINLQFNKNLVNTDIQVSDLNNIGNQINFSAKGSSLALTSNRYFHAGEENRFKITINSKSVYFGFTSTKSSAEIIFYPNPINIEQHDELHVSNVPAFSTFRIISFAGKEVYKKSFNQAEILFSLNFKKNMDKSLSSGMYYWFLESAETNKSGKFTIIK